MIKQASSKTVVGVALIAAMLFAGGATGAPMAAAAAVGQSPTIEGIWSTRTRENDSGRHRIQLSMEIDRDRGDTWNTGFGIDPDDLSGLSFDQAAGDVDNARFQLIRDAGTVTFEGVIRNGRGAGTFSFVPNAGWVGEMRDLGYDDLSATQVFQGALHDITTEYVTALQDIGYTDLPEDELFSFAIHRVTIEFITEMNGLGYADIPPHSAIQLRIHGVSPEWVREVRRAMGG